MLGCRYTAQINMRRVRGGAFGYVRGSATRTNAVLVWIGGLWKGEPESKKRWDVLSRELEKM